MKKTLTILIALTMLLSVSACGNSELQQSTSSKSSSSDLSSSQTDNSQVSSKSADTKLSRTYNVPLQKIYIDVPNYQEIEQAYTELFIIHDSRYVSITSAFDDVANTPKEAHKVAFKEMIPNMQNYEGGMNSLNITKDEETTINGIDMYLFEGTINYGTDTKFDGYAKGCAFVLDGIPCEIVGSVIDKSQSQELIAEISEIVDEMTQTVRSEE